MMLLVSVAVLLVALGAMATTTKDTSRGIHQQDYRNKMVKRPSHKGRGILSYTRNFFRDRKVELSVVILVDKKNERIEELLLSAIHQKSEVDFEIIVVDNACIPGTKDIVLKTFRKDTEARIIPYEYLPLCNTSEFALAKNNGVDAANELSDWILFLQGDIIPRDEDFIQNMMDITKKKPLVGGVACKILTEYGEELIEAGSIVWNDVAAAAIGRGFEYSYSSQFSYAKPVDYGSGSCLVVNKQIFVDYKGFDNKNFPKHYADTDLQMHIQHDLGKVIWYQPLGVVFQAEDASHNEENEKALISESAERFLQKWKDKVQTKHLENPHSYERHEQELQIMRASDLRARDPNVANILWLEQAVPNPGKGSGFLGRAFDNLSMVAELGHKITLVLQQKLTASWCDLECRNQIASLGVEMITVPLEEYVENYIDFYDIVYISRSEVLRQTYRTWQKAYEKHSFTLIYDCEALWHRRDEVLVSLLETGQNYYEFPGGVDYFGVTKKDIDVAHLEMKHRKDVEMKLIQMADAVIMVSKREEDIVLDLLPGTETYTVGQIMNINESGVVNDTFHDRSGILFLASFSDNMYYNGDAVWYFLTHVYPLVLGELSSPIPLTIAGQEIPDDLYKLVKDNELLSKNVFFRESVEDIHKLYNSTRIFIAPHLHGAGIQYEVSEAFSLGIPTVMTPFTAASFGINGQSHIGCVGNIVQGLKDCIIDLLSSKDLWTRAQQDELEFIRQTHKRNDAMNVLKKAIETNFQKIKEIRKTGDSHKMEHGLTTITFNEAQELCPEGEKHYLMKYLDVKEAVKANIFSSGFMHYDQFGKAEGKTYICHNYNSYISNPTKLCAEGEERYAQNYPDVTKAIKEGMFETHFAHYQLHGKQEGKLYKCLDSVAQLS